MATKRDFENAARIFAAELDICAHVLHNADADPEAQERAYGSPDCDRSRRGRIRERIRPRKWAV